MAADSIEPEEAVARALSSPLRMRILRFCLHEERTNREIAEEFELNPGTSLHHVRTLLDVDMLAAGEPRRGKRGAKEVPYRATRRSWGTPVPDIAPVLVRAFLDDIDGLDPRAVDASRLGLFLDEDGERQFGDELRALLQRWSERPPDPGGRPVSVFAAVHRERPSRGAAGEQPRDEASEETGGQTAAG